MSASSPVPDQSYARSKAIGRNRGDEEARVIAYAPWQLYIGGQWRDALTGARFAVKDPSTGRTLCEVADASPDDAVAALDAAVASQVGWAATPPNERSEILYRAFLTLNERADELALLMTLEMGKAIAESKAEIVYAAEFFRWFAGEALRVEGYCRGASHDAPGVLVVRQPVGPSYLITPWNFPTAMGARKIAPAIAAGCAMVWKPAHQTPLSALALAELLSNAGLPPGVLNVVTSSSPRAVSEPILANPRLRKLSFTGSTQVGRELIAHSAGNVLNVSMELGGNAPFMVFDDADLDAAVDGALFAKMRNVGQACTAANRFLVHETVASEFSARLAKQMGALRVGAGSDPGIEIGPLIDATQRNKVAELVSNAIEEGARPLTGGHALDGPGYFYAPTVLADVPATARLLHEEIFGPVAPLVTFTDEEEAIAAANATEYGLVAYLYTRDLRRAMRVVARLEAGMVGLNRGAISNASAPFGGWKASGIGREAGREGIDEYLETKYVAVNP